MNDALNSGDAYSVNALYSEVYDSKSKRDKYDERIADFLSQVKEDLNNQNFDEEAEVSGADTVPNYVKDKYGSLILSDDGINIDQSISVSNRELWDEILNLIASKNHYCSGVYYYKTENNYKEAIQNFADVDANDSLYENSKTMIGECTDAYISSILQQVDEYIQKGDMGSGIDLLETAKSWLEENGVNSEEIQAKIDEVLVSYAEKYAINAENAFKEHDVNGAIGNIEVAIELQPDNGDYKTKYNTYQQYLPFALYLEENVLYEDETGDIYGGVEYDSTLTSNNNKTMINTIRLYNNKNEDDGSSWNVYYNLAGKYDTVSGVIFLDEFDKNNDGIAYFKVYGDRKLLYTSPKITAGVLPNEISFDVSSIQKLTISFYGEDSSGCVSQLIAQKDFPE